MNFYFENGGKFFSPLNENYFKTAKEIGDFRELCDANTSAVSVHSTLRSLYNFLYKLPLLMIHSCMSVYIIENNRYRIRTPIFSEQKFCFHQMTDLYGHFVSSQSPLVARNFAKLVGKSRTISRH